jgi:galactosamine-6-phosphate isomerase
MMQLHIAPDIPSLACHAADIVCDLLAARPAAHLCLAAGGTPRPLYRELVGRAQSGSVSFAEARITKLDEWHGLPMSDPATCETDLRIHLLDPLGIRPEQYLGFDSMAPNPEAEARRVAECLKGLPPFDVSVLGLGLNGHIGMNEPADGLPPHTHVAELAEQSRHHAMLRELDSPPTHGLTMGLADLMHSRQIILLVTGEAKRHALQRLLTGPITTRFPASLLLLHPCCSCLADAESSAAL